MTRCPHCGKIIDDPGPAAVTTEDLRNWCLQNQKLILPLGRVRECIAAEILNRGCGTLKNWRAQKVPLPFQRTRGRVTYRLEDIARFLNESTNSNYP
jgi:hypothetical protein